MCYDGADDYGVLPEYSYQCGRHADGGYCRCGQYGDYTVCGGCGPCGGMAAIRNMVVDVSMIDIATMVLSSPYDGAGSSQDL